MILRPAWKLLNQHLPVFTEVLAYNQPIPVDETDPANDDDEDSDEDEEEVEENDYEDFDEKDLSGVEGMTFHLLELLTSLVQRPSV